MTPPPSALVDARGSCQGASEPSTLPQAANEVPATESRRANMSEHDVKPRVGRLNDGDVRMRQISNLAAAAGAAFITVTPAVSATPVAQPPRLQYDVAGFPGNADTLPQAVRAIEREGGMVLEIRYQPLDGAPGYNAAVARGGRVEFVRMVDPAGPSVLIAAHSEPDWMLGWRGRADVRLAKKMKVSLIEAIRTAEKQAGGRPAVAAGIAPSASNPSSRVHAYNVLLLRNGDTQRIAVDSRSGLIIANPGALRG